MEQNWALAQQFLMYTSNFCCFQIIFKKELRVWEIFHRTTEIVWNEEFLTEFMDEKD